MNADMPHKIVLSGEALLELIPQRSPIVMVDQFLGMTGMGSYTGLAVREDNIFCENGCLQEFGLIEHIAQSAAVRVGYLYHSRNETIPVGFIGSVDKLTLHYLPRVGAELYTEIKVEQDIFDITLISARVYDDGNLVADGWMKIFLKKENE